MLVAPAPRPFDELDQRVFQALAPADHYRKKAAAAIDFERLRPLAADRYSPGLPRWNAGALGGMGQVNFSKHQRFCRD